MNYYCQLSSNGRCDIVFSCSNCIIDVGAVLTVTSLEKVARASEIYVNVTSDSSIPQEISSFTTKLSANHGYIFIGNNPSKFYFTVTPSLFESDATDWPSKLTGYHVSGENTPLPGSEYLNTEMPIAYQVQVEIHLDKGISSLYTQRFISQSALTVISALLGSVFGVMGAVGGVMKTIEKQILNVKRKINKKESFDDIMNKRSRIKSNTGDSANDLKNFEIKGEKIKLTSLNHLLEE